MCTSIYFLSNRYEMIVLFLLGLINAQCISLATSKHCTQYKEFSINATRGLFNSTAEYDQFVENESIFDLAPRDTSCPAFAKAKGSNFKFSTSFACSFSVFLATTTPNGCSVNLASSFRRVCNSSIQTARNEVSAKLATTCNNKPFWSSYKSFVDTAPSNNCFVGIGRDALPMMNFVGTNFPPSLAADATTTVTTDTVTSTSSIDVASSTSNVAITFPPSQPTTTTAAANDLESFNPLYIAGGAIVLALIVILLSAIFFMISRKAPKEQTEPSKTSQNYANEERYDDVEQASSVDDAAKVVVYDYDPALSDELRLNVGDIITITEDYDDGWALGTNLASGLSGTFPLVCVGPLNTPQIEGTNSLTYNKRSSSIYIENDDQRQSDVYGNVYGRDSEMYANQPSSPYYNRESDYQNRESDIFGSRDSSMYGDRQSDIYGSGNYNSYSHTSPQQNPNNRY
ncbi:hypothetical protein BC833DRAFT_594436 [Globomyces pollinis-pini]|nr:hypothetical protein BC833DRAFT_594436 [Globomyces pollinis-pini]